MPAGTNHLVVFVVLASVLSMSACMEESAGIGATTTQPKPVKTALEQFIESSEKTKAMPEGRYSYTVYYNATAADGGIVRPSMGGYHLQDLKQTQNVYVLGDKSKTVIDAEVMGVRSILAVYRRGGRTVDCFESLLRQYVSRSGRITCVSGDDAGYLGDAIPVDDPIKPYQIDVRRSNITLVGERVHAGGRCSLFRVEPVSPSEVNISTIPGFQASDGSLQDVRFIYTVCLDEEKGYVAYYSLTASSYSELALREFEVFSVTKTLDGYDPEGAADGDFTVPVDFGMTNLQCNENDVTFRLTAFNGFEGEVNVTINQTGNWMATDGGRAGKTSHRSMDVGHMEVGDNKLIDVPTTEKLSGSYRVSACSNMDNCVRGDCYAYDRTSWLTTAPKATFTSFQAPARSCGASGVGCSDVQAKNATTATAARLNIDYGVSRNSCSCESGPAVVGDGKDYWNAISEAFSDNHTAYNLILADGTRSAISANMVNLGGMWAICDGTYNTGIKDAIDRMYNTFSYPQYNQGGDSYVSLTNVPKGDYDLYLIGHGGVPTQNGAYSVSTAEKDYGAKESSDKDDAVSEKAWREGVQYVEYQNITITDGTLNIRLKPGGKPYYDTIINGLQLVPAGTQKANQTYAIK